MRHDHRMNYVRISGIFGLIACGLLLALPFDFRQDDNTVRAAEVRIGITVRADRVDRNPITAIVRVGDTIKWTSQAVDAGEAARIRITLTAVGGNPFVGGVSYDSGIVNIGADIPASPAVRAQAATATPNTYSYEIRLFRANGEEITARREPRNFIWVPGAQDGNRRVRGLFVSGPPEGALDADVEHLRDVIHDGNTGFGTNWAARPTVRNDRTQEQLVDDIAAASAGADDDDIFVFLFGGHGSKTHDAKDDEPAGAAGDTSRVRDSRGTENLVCATPECDERILVTQDTRIDDDNLGNGAISTALAGARGIKVLIFNSCFSGGLMDRRLRAAGLDLPISNSIVITACTTNQYAGISASVAFGHGHSYFTGSFISGFLNVDPIGDAERPPEGVVTADPNPNDGQATGSVTVRNWFDFASSQTAAILASRKMRVSRKDPLINDDFAAMGHRATDLVVFRYNRRTISNHEHVDPGEVPEPEIPQCGCDFGDAPDPFRGIPGQYPTEEESTGACHQVFALEWLGARTDSEEPDADTERDGIDSDEDGDEGDNFDDGVQFIQRSETSLEVLVTVSVADREFINSDGLPRYDRRDRVKRLYLNAWADWNGDGNWTPDEKIIGVGPDNFAIDPREDSQFLDDNTATYSFPIPLPANRARDFYFRFRLDYGEDVGEIHAVDPSLYQEKGTARFGEVEDYCAGSPDMRISAMRPGPPAQIDITVQGTLAGLGSIVVLEAINAAVTIPPFQVGTTNPVIVTATKIDQAARSSVVLRACSTDGCCAEGDPVITQLEIPEGRRSVTETFTGIPQAESYITVQNGAPGLRMLTIEVNDKNFGTFRLGDNEVTTLDVSSLMVEGDNTITLSGYGQPGSSALIVISDRGSGQPNRPLVRWEVRGRHRGQNLTWGRR